MKAYGLVDYTLRGLDLLSSFFWGAGHCMMQYVGPLVPQLGMEPHTAPSMEAWSLSHPLSC